MIIDGIESSTRWQYKTLPKTWGDRFNTSIADVSLPQALPMLSQVLSHPPDGNTKPYLKHGEIDSILV